MKRYFEVGYTKKIGGLSQMIVAANNGESALHKAKNIRHTGSDFHLIGEIDADKVDSTAVGVGAKMVKRNIDGDSVNGKKI